MDIETLREVLALLIGGGLTIIGGFLAHRAAAETAREAREEEREDRDRRELASAQAADDEAVFVALAEARMTTNHIHPAQLIHLSKMGDDRRFEVSNEIFDRMEVARRTLLVASTRHHDQIVVAAVDALSDSLLGLGNAFRETMKQPVWNVDPLGELYDEVMDHWDELEFRVRSRRHERLGLPAPTKRPNSAELRTTAANGH